MELICHCHSRIPTTTTTTKKNEKKKSQEKRLGEMTATHLLAIVEELLPLGGKKICVGWCGRKGVRMDVFFVCESTPTLLLYNCL